MSYTGWTTANKIRASTGIITAVPLTMACWAYMTTVGVNQHLMGCYNSASTGDLNQFSLGCGPSNNVQAKTGQNPSTGFTNTTTAFSANTWFHACAVFPTIASRSSYLNGGGVATNTTSLTPSGINRTTVGNRDSSTNDRSPSATSRIAEAAMWNVALDTGEIQALASGASPMLIRPQNLVVYLPLISDFIDYKGSGFAIVGALSATDHTRVIGGL